MSQRDAIEREGVAALADLTAMLAKAGRVVLLLAAGDVSLLRVQVPPLSPARLKAALPNLVEDQLMSDPSECVIVAGPAAQGLRTVAVAQRAWLEIILKTMQAYGARHIVALPAQMCLPHQAGFVAAAVAYQDAEIDLTLRLSEHEGLGLPILEEQPAAVAADVLQALAALVPEGAITLHVPQAAVGDYRDALGAAPAMEQRVTVFADHWSRWIGGAAQAGPDLMAALGAGGATKEHWRPWRWPLALAAVLLLVNSLGLNIDWWRMKNEAAALRASVIQTYKAAYPKETVIIDPVAQMKQKIAAAQHASGQLAPDDFTILAARFGAAWERAASGGALPAIAALEYRERSLFVRPKTESAPSAQLSAALAAQNLSLAQASGGAWQIRSAK